METDWQLELTVALLALGALGYFIRDFARNFTFNKMRLIIFIAMCAVGGGGLLSLTVYASDPLPCAWLRALNLASVLGIFALACACQPSRGILGDLARIYLKCQARS